MGTGSVWGKLVPQVVAENEAVLSVLMLLC